MKVKRWEPNNKPLGARKQAKLEEWRKLNSMATVYKIENRHCYTTSSPIDSHSNPSPCLLLISIVLDDCFSLTAIEVGVPEEDEYESL